MKNEKQLINNVIGQLAGVSRMITADKDCLDILTQLKAAKATLNKVVAMFLHCHLEKCLQAKKRDEKKYKKIVAELTNNL